MRRQHFDELEADFQQYYNLNFTAVRPARAARLMYQLPMDSRLMRVLQPANNWGWQEVLLNKTSYLLEIVAWLTANQGVKKSKQTAKPQMYTPDFMQKVLESKALNPEQSNHTIDEVKEILARPRH